MTIFIAAVLLIIAFLWRPIGTIAAVIVAGLLCLLMLIALFGTARGGRKPYGVSVFILAATVALPLLFPPLPGPADTSASAAVTDSGQSPSASPARGMALAFSCPTPMPTATVTVVASPTPTRVSATPTAEGSAAPLEAAMSPGCPTSTTTVLTALYTDGDACVNAGERYAMAGVDLVCTDDRNGTLVWMEKTAADQLAADRASEKAAADAKAAGEAKAAADAKASADAKAAADAAAEAQAQQQSEAQPPVQAVVPGQGTAAVPGAVTPGAFCSSRQAGALGYTKTGLAMYCTKDPSGSSYRWRQ